MFIIKEYILYRLNKNIYILNYLYLLYYNKIK